MMIPEQHQAVTWDPAAESFVATTRLTEQPQGHDLLVAVAAAALNPVDLKVRGFLGRSDPPRVLGYDAVGMVLAVGPQASGFAPGDRVWYAGAAHRPGANAQMHLVDARIVGLAPSSLSDADAAALPLTGLTAWEGLFERLGYAPGRAPESAKPQPGLLMINGAGGVGSITLQLARWAGIPATATAARTESQHWCRRMGASEVLPHEAMAGLPDSTFARIFCAHDTSDYIETMGRLVAVHGRVCSIVGARGPLNLMPMFQKSAGFFWEYMFTRPMHDTADIARQGEILTELARLVDAGEIVSTRTRTLQGLSPETLTEAHAAQAAGASIGKTVIVYD